MMSNGYKIQYQQADLLGVTRTESSFDVCLQISDPLFYIACSQLHRELLITIFNTGNCVTLNLKTNDIKAFFPLKCEDFQALPETGNNADENNVHPVHFSVQQARSTLNLTIYAVESPLKNLNS